MAIKPKKRKGAKKTANSKSISPKNLAKKTITKTPKRVLLSRLFYKVVSMNGVHILMSGVLSSNKEFLKKLGGKNDYWHTLAYANDFLRDTFGLSVYTKKNSMITPIRLESYPTQYAESSRGSLERNLHLSGNNTCSFSIPRGQSKDAGTVVFGPGPSPQEITYFVISSYSTSRMLINIALAMIKETVGLHGLKSIPGKFSKVDIVPEPGGVYAVYATK